MTIWTKPLRHVSIFELTQGILEWKAGRVVIFGYHVDIDYVLLTQNLSPCWRPIGEPSKPGGITESWSSWHSTCCSLGCRNSEWVDMQSVHMRWSEDRQWSEETLNRFRFASQYSWSYFQKGFPFQTKIRSFWVVLILPVLHSSLTFCFKCFHLPLRF